MNAMGTTIALITTLILAISYTHLRPEHRHPGGVLLHAIIWHGIIIYDFTDVGECIDNSTSNIKFTYVAFPGPAWSILPINITIFILAIIVLDGVFWFFCWVIRGRGTSSTLIGNLRD
ncbi:hypothetical protein BDR07DRAFT_14276 [Suillus spraguei]|nr:hypothetical protein BDR07DRAFT_14276 [Suillus spraguei]